MARSSSSRRVMGGRRSMPGGGVIRCICGRLGNSFSTTSLRCSGFSRLIGGNSGNVAVAPGSSGGGVSRCARVRVGPPDRFGSSSPWGPRVAAVRQSAAAAAAVERDLFHGRQANRIGGGNCVSGRFGRRARWRNGFVRVGKSAGLGPRQYGRGAAGCQDHRQPTASAQHRKPQLVRARTGFDRCSKVADKTDPVSKLPATGSRSGCAKSAVLSGFIGREGEER